MRAVLVTVSSFPWTHRVVRVQVFHRSLITCARAVHTPSAEVTGPHRWCCGALRRTLDGNSESDATGPQLRNIRVRTLFCLCTVLERLTGMLLLLMFRDLDP